MFQSLVFYFIGVGAKRAEIFEKQVTKYNGTVSRTRNGAILTHVVFDEAMAGNLSQCRQQLGSHLECLDAHARHVTARWLTECLKSKVLVDTGPFELSLDDGGSTGRTDESDRKRPHNNSDVVVSSPTQSDKKGNENYLCSEASSKRAKFSNNEAIIVEFQKLAEAYRATKDTWRMLGYEKAISAIKRHDTEITKYQDAATIPGVGPKLAQKAMEVLECGSIRKVAEVCDNPRTKLLELFCNVWGAGPTTAEAWLQQGCTSLDDVAKSAQLTMQQRIGLKHFDEFLLRIPRSEVAEFGELVKEAVSRLSREIKTTLVGSFRRGKETSGDIDVMIVNSSSLSPADILSRILDTLKSSGVITDDLTAVEHSGRQRKWMGVARLSQNHPHRRLDLFVVPAAEEATALMHYTGSAFFNRSSRLLASRLGMCLTEHGLYKNTIRKGAEITSEGEMIPVSCEEDVFRELGLEFKRPEQRDH